MKKIFLSLLLFTVVATQPTASKDFSSQVKKDGGGDWDKSELKQQAKYYKHRAQAYAKYALLFNIKLERP